MGGEVSYFNCDMSIIGQFRKARKKSCIQETPNLLTNGDRSNDTERNIEGFDFIYFLVGFGWAGKGAFNL